MFDALAIGPHPDDVELGMGGLVVQMVRWGWQVAILDLTDGEPTPHGDPQTRRQEAEAARQVLGVQTRIQLDLPNRRLENTLQARAQVAAVMRQLKPRLVFCPYWEDAHPDHVAATRLVEDARFWSKLTKTDLPGEPHYPARIVYYYGMHLRIAEPASFVVDISDAIEQKMAAVGCYRSQFIVGRPTTAPTLLDDIRDRARYWGYLIRRAYGEPFTVREPVGLTHLEHLT